MAIPVGRPVMLLLEMGLIMLVLGHPCAGSAVAAPDHRRLQAEATAIASAVAQGNAQVQSTANAVSTGTPTLAAAIGRGIAGPGQTVVVRCNQSAVNEQIARYCEGIPTPSSGGAQTTAWHSAPACKQTPVGTVIAVDGQGNPWGYDNNISCAFR